MRTLVHLSDLHFGRTDAAIVASLIDTVRELKPDIVVVSGDLTQRARSAQFQAAKRFLAALPQPQIVVPGNHDVPLHNVFARMLTPLHKYRRYITEDLTPFFADEEIAVIGISTARSLVMKNGRVNSKQLELLRETFKQADAKTIKVVVTHHPFDLGDDRTARDLVGRAGMALRDFCHVGVDLLMAGHIHQSWSNTTASRYQLGDYSAVAVQAGTATSIRRRDEVNAFNLVRTEPASITVIKYGWQSETGGFTALGTAAFAKLGKQWVPAPVR